jgi:serine/threonine protein phosphatase PrpC
MGERLMATWRTLAASLRGSGHERQGLPCQDAYAWDVWDVASVPVLVAAVADGAGTALRGELGAAEAVRAAVAAMRRDLGGGPPTSLAAWHDLLTAAVEEARQAVDAAAATASLQPRDLATTLILTACTPEGVFAVQVGDGAAVAGAADGAWHAVTRPVAGEYANETIFLCSPHAVETAQRGAWEGPVAAVAAFSDGLQRLALKLPEGAPHAPFFAPLCRFLERLPAAADGRPALEAFLTSPRLRERSDDDCTLVLALCQAAENAVAAQ